MIDMELLTSVVREQATGESFENWCEKNEVDEDALKTFVLGYGTRIDASPYLPKALLVGFRIGFDVAKQYKADN